MVNLLNSAVANRIFLYSVLATFPLAVLTPPPAYAQFEIGLEDINFGLRIEKHIEKLWKYLDREDSNKMLDTMIDIKIDTEGYLKCNFDIDRELDKAEIELKKAGGKFSKKDLKEVRKAIKKRVNKSQKRSLCMSSYLQEKPSISFAEYEAIYELSNKEKEEEQEVKDLPIRLTIGVTMILAGGFLCTVGVVGKIPACVNYGKEIAFAGAAFAIDGFVDGKEKQEDKDKR